MSSDKRRAVPKFASFKPTQIPEPEPEPESGSDSGPKPTAGFEERKKGKPDASRKEDKLKLPHRRHDDHGERENEREKGHRRRREHHSLSRKKRDDETSEAERKIVVSQPTNNLYFVDKRGDPLILRYGSNDRNKVPSYYRFGSGRLMGASGLLSLHHDGSREEFSIRSHQRNSGSIFRDKRAISAIAAASRNNPRHIRPSEDTGRLPTESDEFILLEPSRKRKRGEEPSSRVDYRSIYGKSGNDGSGSESDSDNTSSGSEDTVIEMTITKKRSIELSRQVRGNPGDTAAWRQLIDLQDALFRENQVAATSPTAEEAKGLAELKLSLYEETLPHATQADETERILLGLMREGARVWDPKTLTKRWEDVSKSHGDSFLLWRERLNFELSRVADCTQEGSKVFIMDKLRALGKKLLDTSVIEDTGKGNELCSQLIYNFLRLTRFLVDSGYSELAVAAWQAELEMVFCRPVVLSKAAEDTALASFSEFWESEVTRIGEEGAKGWREFEETGGMADPPDPKSDKPGEPLKTRDKFKAWATVELQKASRSHIPARTLDEGTEDDPFRVVMFSDIKELLVWLPTAVLSRVGTQLLDAFLLFCGLPTARLSSGLVDDARNDPFVAGQSEAFEIDLDSTTPGTLDETKRTPELRQQGGSMAFSQNVLFSGTTWFRYLDNWQRMGWSDAHSTWILETLKQLVKGHGQEQLAEYYLAAAWLNEPNSARKVAKGLLKQYSSNLRLYSAYALIESANGNPDVSEKVLSAATSQELSAPTTTQLLFNTWTWIHLESNKKQEALHRLCSSVDRSLEASPPPPSFLLTARAHFSSIRDYALSSQELETAIQFAESQALLDYLTAEGSTEAASETQGNITAALASIHDFSSDLTSRGLASSLYHERLLQTAARLLYYHSTHGPYRPLYIRSRLLQFIELFPQNTLFLTLFAWAQPTIRIDDPVRAALQDHALVPPYDSLATRRFAIAHEARTGTAHSTRAAFEAALDGVACRGNADMWVRYIRLCCSRKELQSLAKDVLYRALGACPLSKVVYMEAFGTLLREMGSAELRGVFDTMTTKGLRVHVDLEEWIGKWEQEREQEKGKKAILR